MKNILFFFSLMLSSTLIYTQEVIIPDSIFKDKLLNCNTCATFSDGSWGIVDKNKNGKIEVSEADSVIELNLEPLFVTFDQDGELHQGGEIQNLGGINSFKNLQALKCPYNKITSLDLSGLNNLKILDCKYNKLTNLIIRELSNLTNLSCSNNQLTSLDCSGLSNLGELICSNNQLTILKLNDVNSLRDLRCSNNLIKKIELDKSILTLEDLDVSFNPLENTDYTIFKNLRFLNCSGLGLMELNLQGLNNLVSLMCSNNKITSLDLTSSNISWLICNDNKLKTLEISSYFYDFNEISLGPLYLNCSNNMIKDLKLIGELDGLNCENNLIETLDLSKSRIKITFWTSTSCNFELGNNPLTLLILKNGHNDFMQDIMRDWCNIIPKSLKYICCDEDEIQNINNLVKESGNKNIEVNSYCSFTPGGKFYVVKGQAKYGMENSNCQGTDVSAFPNLKFNITGNINSGTLITNSTGTFEIPVQEGSHTITPILEFPDIFSITPTSFKATFPNTTDTIIQNFCITPKVSVSNVIIEIVPLTVARPGFEATYKIIITNKGTKIENGSLNFNFDNNILKLISSTLTPESVNGGIINWKFENLKPFESIEIIVVLKVNSPMDVPAINAGDIFNLTASILNNKKTINISVVGSYDPNDKTCLQGNQLRTELIGKYVDYLIRFENTGNYFAENVVIKDIIDTTRFQVSSLEVVNSSHKMVTRINQNVVEYIFENIKLPFPPDDKRHGYVLFKIKTKDNIKLGDSLRNEASIYFDYNFPIKTNRFESIVRNPSSTNNESIIEASIYPNPVKDILTFKSDHIIKTAEIYNVQGQLMEAIINPSENIRLSHLINGTYVIKLHSKEGVYTLRFIKM